MRKQKWKKKKKKEIKDEINSLILSVSLPEAWK